MRMNRLLEEQRSRSVGMAQDLTASGVELPAPMHAGWWQSSKMPARYTEGQAAGRGAVARYYQGERGLAYSASIGRLINRSGSKRASLRVVLGPHLLIDIPGGSPLSSGHLTISFPRPCKPKQGSEYGALLVIAWYQQAITLALYQVHSVNNYK